jgi:hydroxymethylpyrimidine/phosphomethylpyrimidine kinase
VPRPAVLVIAATDSSGGAGLTRDVRVLTDFGVDALCVVTAVTAQSDKKVTAVHHVPPEVIRAQIAAAFATRQIGAIKIGMLGTQATVEAVVAELLAVRSSSDVSAHMGGQSGGSPLGASVRAEGRRQRSGLNASLAGAIPIVVDPVLVSTSGGMLLDAAGQAALTASLFRIATLVTPNIPEAAALLGEPLAANEADLIRQGEKLLGFGSEAILLKGGHRDGEEAVDLLISGASIERIASKRVVGSCRGTGCALASGIAAGLAAGNSLGEACRAAKHYVAAMLAPAYTGTTMPSD